MFNRPKSLRFAVVLLNDDTHTPEYVARLLEKIGKIKGHESLVKAMDVHSSGSTLVYQGSRFACRRISRRVRRFGPDKLANETLVRMGKTKGEPMKTKIIDTRKERVKGAKYPPIGIPRFMFA